MKPYLPGMRILALIAFVALQLSMFTCEDGIHVHGMDGETGHFTQHQDESGENGADLLVDQACQLHASHIFLHQGVCDLEADEAIPEQRFSLASLSLINSPRLIEHPPKQLHG